MKLWRGNGQGNMLSSLPYPLFAVATLESLVCKSVRSASHRNTVPRVCENFTQAEASLLNQVLLPYFPQPLHLYLDILLSWVLWPMQSWERRWNELHAVLLCACFLCTTLSCVGYGWYVFMNDGDRRSVLRLFLNPLATFSASLMCVVLSGSEFKDFHFWPYYTMQDS